jgi:hypothetical protein
LENCTDILTFADPTEMIKQLRQKGFRTTVWITPFANLDSEAFGEGTSKGYWLTDKSKSVPALVKWWQGIGAVFEIGLWVFNGIGRKVISPASNLNESIPYFAFILSSLALYQEVAF